MKKYFQVAKNTIQEMVAYRLSFLLYRTRNIMSVLTMYFLWLAVLPKNGTFAGYDQQMILTYIFGTSLVSTLVMASRSQAIGDEINEGNLSNHLLRPMSYFKYWFARDMGDKLVNVIFGIVELTLLFSFLKPPLFLQTNPVYLLLFIVALMIGIVNYFFISVGLGMIGFWSRDIWAPRFIFYTVLIFFSGGLFPLDILPHGLSLFFQALPFAYLLYFPVKVYLGQLPVSQVFIGFAVSVVWSFILYQIINAVWQKGLKLYTAYGR